jgi:hypothetical protein
MGKGLSLRRPSPRAYRRQGRETGWVVLFFCPDHAASADREKKRATCGNEKRPITEAKSREQLDSEDPNRRRHSGCGTHSDWFRQRRSVEQT